LLASSRRGEVLRAIILTGVPTVAFPTEPVIIVRTPGALPPYGELARQAVTHSAVRHFVSDPQRSQPLRDLDFDLL